MLVLAFVGFLVQFVTFSGVAVIYLVNLLSWLWADLLYALALGLFAFYVAGLVLA